MCLLQDDILKIVDEKLISAFGKNNTTTEKQTFAQDFNVTQHDLTADDAADVPVLIVVMSVFFCFLMWQLVRRPSGSAYTGRGLNPELPRRSKSILLKLPVHHHRSPIKVLGYLQLSHSPWGSSVPPTDLDYRLDSRYDYYSGELLLASHSPRRRRRVSGSAGGSNAYRPTRAHAGHSLTNCRLGLVRQVQDPSPRVDDAPAAGSTSPPQGNPPPAGAPGAPSDSQPPSGGADPQSDAAGGHGQMVQVQVGMRLGDFGVSDAGVSYFISIFNISSQRRHESVGGNGPESESAVGAAGAVAETEEQDDEVEPPLPFEWQSPPAPPADDALAAPPTPPVLSDLPPAGTPGSAIGNHPSSAPPTTHHHHINEAAGGSSAQPQLQGAQGQDTGMLLQADLPAEDGDDGKRAQDGAADESTDRDTAAIKLTKPESQAALLARGDSVPTRKAMTGDSQLSAADEEGGKGGASADAVLKTDKSSEVVISPKATVASAGSDADPILIHGEMVPVGGASLATRAAEALSVKDRSTAIISPEEKTALLEDRKEHQAADSSFTAGSSILSSEGQEVGSASPGGASLEKPPALSGGRIGRTFLDLGVGAACVSVLIRLLLLVTKGRQLTVMFSGDRGMDPNAVEADVHGKATGDAGARGGTEKEVLKDQKDHTKGTSVVGVSSDSASGAQGGGSAPSEGADSSEKPPTLHRDAGESQQSIGNIGVRAAVPSGLAGIVHSIVEGEIKRVTPGDGSGSKLEGNTDDGQAGEASDDEVEPPRPFEWQGPPTPTAKRNGVDAAGMSEDTDGPNRKGRVDVILGNAAKSAPDDSAHLDEDGEQSIKRDGPVSGTPSPPRDQPEAASGLPPPADVKIPLYEQSPAADFVPEGADGKGGAPGQGSELTFTGRIHTSPPRRASANEVSRGTP
jgi:hypothetical protein